MSSKKIALRRFKSFFGVTPKVCSLAWNEIQNGAPNGSQPKHFFMVYFVFKGIFVRTLPAFNFRSRREDHSRVDLDICQASVEYECNLTDSVGETIRWSRRRPNIFCTLDGVDFKILEPTPFSHKFRGPDVLYEIALNIRTGGIVWAHGAYPCGQYPDLTLAREAYTLLVNPGELSEADSGYNDPTFFIRKTPNNAQDHGLLMARHETVNKRMKQFNALKNPFRHALEKQPMVFHAVANVTQLMIENGHPLFSIVK